MVHLQNNMRVLARFGYGIITESLEYDRFKITLDKEFAGEKEHILEYSDFIKLTQFCILSVINLSGYKLVSNCIFPEGIKETFAIFKTRHSPDHTIYFFNFNSNAFEINQKLICPEDYFIVAGWCDRWGVEELRVFQDETEAKKEFQNIKEKYSGTSCGIALYVILDMKNQRILDKAILTEIGFLPYEI